MFQFKIIIVLLVSIFLGCCSPAESPESSSIYICDVELNYRRADPDTLFGIVGFIEKDEYFIFIDTLGVYHRVSEETLFSALKINCFYLDDLNKELNRKFPQDKHCNGGLND